MKLCSLFKTWNVGDKSYSTFAVQVRPFPCPNSYCRAVPNAASFAHIVSLLTPTRNFPLTLCYIYEALRNLERASNLSSAEMCFKRALSLECDKCNRTTSSFFLFNLEPISSNGCQVPQCHPPPCPGYCGWRACRPLVHLSLSQFTLRRPYGSLKEGDKTSSGSLL